MRQLLVFDPSYLPTLESKLFFEGPLKARNTVNFAVLLGLATVIATYGVLSDSTATVVGAMIVAPLMTPIMATAAALTMGNFARASKSLALVGLGAMGVIGLSFVLSFWMPEVSVSFTHNAEITSRISPGLLALFVALASGAAGGFATIREEISDSMPGVAIAISLVPPLSVVGIALTRWNLSAAARANIQRCARRDVSALEQLGRCDQAHQPAGNGAP